MLGGIKQDGLLSRLSRGNSLLGQGAADAGPQFIVESSEEHPIPGILGKADYIGDVPYHPVGEEERLNLSAAVGDPGPVQQVQEGEFLLRRGRTTP